MTTVTIQQRVSGDGHPFSEVFIEHGGRRFYSRNCFVLDDTPHNRSAQAQQFLQRSKRFPIQGL